MKASEIRILPALDPGESYVEPTFMLVETALDEGGEAVTTIEHVASRIVGGKLRWQVSTLGQSVPLTHASALNGPSRSPRAATCRSSTSATTRRGAPTPRRRTRAREPRLERVEIVARQAELLFRRLGSIDDGAKRRVLGPVLRIPRQMLARDADARDLAIERM